MTPIMQQFNVSAALFKTFVAQKPQFVAGDKVRPFISSETNRNKNERRTQGHSMRKAESRQDDGENRLSTGGVADIRGACRCLVTEISRIAPKELLRMYLSF